MSRPAHRKLLFAAALLLLLGGVCWWFASDAGKEGMSAPLLSGKAERSGRGAPSSPEPQERPRSAPAPRPAKVEHAERAELLSEGWRITTGAAEAADLTDEERSRAQAVVDQMKGEMEASVKARLVVDEAASDRSKDILAYKVSALPDRGADFRARYRNGLRSAVGPEKGDVLYGALAKGKFGGYGRYDVDLKFYPSPRAGATGAHLLEWTHRNPDTQEALGTSGAVDEVVDRFWGDVFK